MSSGPNRTKFFKGATTVGGAMVLSMNLLGGAAGAAEQAVTELPATEIKDSSETNTAPRVGEAATHAQSATKTDTAIMDTPQSISVVTRAQMDTQNARSVNEALRYVPGVAAEQAGGITAFDQMTIRGFSSTSTGFADTFLDGLRLSNGLVYGTQQVDPFLLDSIDVVKGPASVLYGLASPGGIVALTSKLPVDRDIRHLDIEGGSNDYKRGAFDFGGRLDDQGEWLYRIAGTGYRSDGQGEHTKADRYAIAPSLMWQPSDDTSLMLFARFQKEPNSGDNTSIPVEGSVFHNRNGHLSSDAFPGEPDHNTFKREQKSFGFRLDQRLSDDWTFMSTARYAHVDMDVATVIFAGLQSDQRTINRATAESEEHFHTVNLDNQLKGSFNTGPLQHDVLLGYSWDNQVGRGNYASGAAPSLDIYNPVYGAAITTPPSLYQDSRVTSRDSGLYAQDQITLGRWRGTFGVRHDWSTIDTHDYLYSNSFKQRDEATTYRAGLVYRFDNGLAPYITYAESFQPVNQLSESGQPFQPSRGKLHEVGVRYQPDGWRGMLSAAAFNILQSNVLETDPNNVAFSVQDGEIRSRGVELEAHAPLNDQLSLISAYTYQRVQYANDDQGVKGKTPLRIPQQYASTWLAWEAPSTMLPGFGAGIGARYLGKTYGGTMDDRFTTASYTLFDAQVHYDLGKLNQSLKGTTVQLSAQNLGDKRYVTSCYSETVGCFFGAGRQVIARLSYDW